MSSVGHILKVKKIYDVNELWFEDDTHQYTAWTGVAPAPACPLIIDCTTGVAGTTAIGITGVGGATSCDIIENGTFTFGEQGAGLNLVYDDTAHVLTCGSSSLNGDVADCSLNTGVLPADTIPAIGPTRQQQYQSNCERGILRFPFQGTLNASTTNFPTGKENVFAGDAQLYNMTGSNTSLCRATGQIITAGSNTIIPFGTKIILSDHMHFDGTQCRGGYSAPDFNRIEIPTELQHAYFRFSMFVDCLIVPSGNNKLICKVNQYRAGVLFNTFPLGSIDKTAGMPRNCSGSFTRDVFGANPTEEILAGDELEWVVEGDAPNVDVFTLTLGQGVFEVLRSV